ncbi:MAG: serine hydrolase domain-containing protein [Candidatus Ventricola sp.]
MQTLSDSLRYLCDETRMLTGMTVAYGTSQQSETMTYGRAQELALGQDGFIPSVRPLGEDSIFDLASLTKLFTCVAAMRLVEQGRLSLGERVGEIDPRFIHLGNVTVLDVMCYRACLQTPGRIDDAPSREEGLARLFAVRTAPLPAVRLYSDINAMVIKYVIETKTGLSFAEALRALIYEPCGMRETFATVPEDCLPRCVCYNYEHRIERDRLLLRTCTPPGTPHDPKALRLSQGGRDLCGHAGLFSTRRYMVLFAQALLAGRLLRCDTLRAIGTDRTGRDNGDGTYRQPLGLLCFTRHPQQRLSEVPAYMSPHAFGLSGFTGNHLVIDPEQGVFALFLGNRCHARVSHITPPEGKSLTDYGLDERGVGQVAWEDGRAVPSSAKYVYFKDACLHEPIAARMRALGWLG